MTEPRRILFFVSSMHAGGAERVAALLCNRWSDLGHKVMLVPTFSGHGGCEYPLGDRVQLHYLADEVPTVDRGLRAGLARIIGMRAIARRFLPDVVVSFLPHVNVATILATAGLGVATVVAERTFPPAMPIGAAWSWLRKATYPYASLVVMQTAAGLEWLGREIPGCRGTRIPNPIVFPMPSCPPERSPDDIVQPGSRLLLGVGRLAEEKGYDKLIEAFAMLAEAHPDWDLAILGEGPERAALEDYRERCGFGDRIHLPGKLGNLGDWYRRASLFALTSRFEGFPNALLEAMSHGVAAVSFDCLTGPSELIRSGGNGILVTPARGVEGFADALADLMNDDAQRAALGKQALRHRSSYAMQQIGPEWDAAIGLSSAGDTGSIPADRPMERIDK